IAGHKNIPSGVVGATGLKSIVTESKQGLAPSLTMNGIEKIANACCAGALPSIEWACHAA
ncbi:hypothetical protein JZU57_02770, partial [bacterium]|nr:hypothetical protein [bacterium]